MIICAAGGSGGRLERRSAGGQPTLLASAIQQFQVKLEGFYDFICSGDPPDNLFETVEKWCISRAFLSVTIHFSFSYFSVVICIWVMKGTESTYNRLDYFDIYFSINPR